MAPCVADGGRFSSEIGQPQYRRVPVVYLDLLASALAWAARHRKNTMCYYLLAVEPTDHL